MSLPSINIPDILDIRLNVVKDIYGTNIIIDRYKLRAKKGWNKLVFRREYPHTPIVLIQLDMSWIVPKKKLEVGISEIQLPSLPELEPISLPSLQLQRLTRIEPEIPRIQLPGISCSIQIPDVTSFTNTMFTAAYNKCMESIPDVIPMMFQLPKSVYCGFIAGLIASPGSVIHQLSKKIVDFVNGLVSGLNTMINQLNNYSDQLQDSLNKFNSDISKLVNSINQLSSQLESWSNNLLNELGYDLIPKLNDMINSLNTMSSNINSFINSLNGFIYQLKNFANGVNELVKNTIGSIDLGNDLFMGYAPAVVRNVTTRSCEIYSPVDGELNILVISM